MSKETRKLQSSLTKTVITIVSKSSKHNDQCKVR